MTSRRSILHWLKSAFGSRRDADTPLPLLLDRPMQDGRIYNSVSLPTAKFQIGQVVRHRHFGFRGVIFDVDPLFANSEDWYESIPKEVRPRKDQPFYHLFAENDRTHYVAYVSEQNLSPDTSNQPLSHPDIPDWFNITPKGTYELKKDVAN